MAASPPTPDRQWVLRLDFVRRSIRDLRTFDSHRFFPAYLHLRQLAGRAGTLSSLNPDWRRFGDYLRVPGALGTPYYSPFMPSSWSDERAWLNANLAGSWAGSSLRVEQPPRQVVDYDAGERTFMLKDKHWELARAQLLNDKRVPLMPLTVFLYRNFSFEGDRQPRSEDLITTFRDDFAYKAPDDNAEFEYLYDARLDPSRGNDWFEPFEPAERAE
jgi:hypothetical protein